MFTSETVLELKPNGGAVTITDGQSHLLRRQGHPHRRAVDLEVSSAGICQSLPQSIARHCAGLRCSRITNAIRPNDFPVFIWITGDRLQDMLYGFPAIDGPSGGIKVATERYEQTVDPDNVPRDVSEDSIAAMYSEYIAPRFPDVSRRCLRTATCLYTVTPDAKFVIDYADSNQNVIFASACSGHGFKHSPAVGEALAQCALQCPPRLTYPLFAWRRLQVARLTTLPPEHRPA